MSWMDEIKRIYRFRCTNKDCRAVFVICGEDITPDIIDEKDGSSHWCTECKKDCTLKYCGFKNMETIGMTHSVTKETFDQNGRIGYKIGKTYISKTKYDYLSEGKIENQYTPAYRAHLEKDSEKNEYLLKTETNKNRAQVGKVMKNLPDGEYVVK